MRKFIFYTKNNYSKLESELERYEALGFRMKSRRFKYFFEFKNCTPKKVKYFIGYNFIKEIGTMDVENELKSEHKANMVFSDSERFYRISDDSCDLQRFKIIRNKYMRKTFKRCILIALGLIFFLAPGIVYALINQILNIGSYFVFALCIALMCYIVEKTFFIFTVD